MLHTSLYCRMATICSNTYVLILLLGLVDFVQGRGLGHEVSWQLLSTCVLAVVAGLPVHRAAVCVQPAFSKITSFAQARGKCLLCQ